MNTYRGSGHRRPYTNPLSTTISSGAVVEMVDEIGIAIADILAGEEGDLAVSGVHELDALTAGTWSAGDTLYWDDSPGELVSNASNNVPAGVADADKAADETTARVLLNGRPGPG